MFNCGDRVIGFCSSRPWCVRLLALVASMQGMDEIHGLPHTVRVLCNALLIGEEEGADLDIVAAAALLHDVGRGVERLGLHHAEVSAALAMLLRPLAPVLLEKAELVAECILRHSYSLGIKSDASLECCVLRDADRLDALGALGVYRTIAHGAVRGRNVEDTIEHFHAKLSRLADTMCTETGRRLARERAELLSSFFKALREEYSVYRGAVEWAALKALEELTPTRGVAEKHGAEDTYSAHTGWGS